MMLTKSIFRFAGLLLLLAILSSGCAQNLVMQGKKLNEQGKYDKAIDLLYKEIANNPQRLEAWRELGVAFYKKGELPKAEEALKKANKTDPGTHLYLGLIAEARNEYDKAVNAYTAALKLNPGSKTKKLLNQQLDNLVVRRLNQQVEVAVETESQIDVGSIPDNTIAVADFDGSNLPPDLAPIAIGLAEFTAADLAKVGSLKLIERRKLDMLVKELNLGSTGMVDPSTAPRMGRLLGSSRLVTGSVLNTGENEIRLDGAVVNVRDSSTKIQEPSEGQLSKFFQIEKDLVFKVINDLGIQLTAEERNAIEKVPTESYLAFLAYCRGLDLRNKGMYQAAQTEFDVAVAEDKNFSAARSESETSASLQQGAVGASALEASLGPTGADRIVGPDMRLNWMVTNTDEHKSAPKVPPRPVGTGTVVIQGDLDGN